MLVFESNGQCKTNLSNLLGWIFQRRRNMLYTSCCDEAIKSLVLLCDFCHRSIEPGGILNVYLTVMDRTSELSDALLGLVVVWCWLWKPINAIH